MAYDMSLNRTNGKSSLLDDKFKTYAEDELGMNPLIDINFNDSDDVEHFSLGPTLSGSKGKRKRKKRPSSISSNPSSSCCITKIYCLIVLFGLLFISATCLAIFTTLLRAEVYDMRERLHSLQTSNREMPEQFQSLHSRIKELNTRVNGIKGLEYLNVQINGILNQISLLNQTSAQLLKSVSAASHIQNLPSKVDALTENIASVGSNVMSLQTDISDLKKFRTNVEVEHVKLAAKVQELQPRSSNPVSAQVVQLSERVNNVTNRLNEVQLKVVYLEAKVLDHVTMLNASIELQTKINANKDAIYWLTAALRALNETRQVSDSVTTDASSVSSDPSSVSSDARYTGILYSSPATYTTQATTLSSSKENVVYTTPLVEVVYTTEKNVDTTAKTLRKRKRRGFYRNTGILSD